MVFQLWDSNDFSFDCTDRRPHPGILATEKNRLLKPTFHVGIVSEKTETYQTEHIYEAHRPKTGGKMRLQGLFEEVWKFREKIQPSPAFQLVDSDDAMHRKCQKRYVLRHVKRQRPHAVG